MTGLWAVRGYVAPDMKRLSLILAASAFLFGACERHSWADDDKNEDGTIDANEKGTKRLYKDHGGHEGGAEDGDKDGADHGDEEKKHD